MMPKNWTDQIFMLGETLSVSWVVQLSRTIRDDWLVTTEKMIINDAINVILRRFKASLFSFTTLRKASTKRRLCKSGEEKRRRFLKASLFFNDALKRRKI